MFDPPFYDNYFFLIPPFSQLFLLDPPRFHQPPPPCELKNDNSLKTLLQIKARLDASEEKLLQILRLPANRKVAAN